MKNRLLYATLLMFLLFLKEPLYAQQMSIERSIGFNYPEYLIDNAISYTETNESTGSFEIVVKMLNTNYLKEFYISVPNELGENYICEVYTSVDDENYELVANGDFFNQDIPINKYALYIKIEVTLNGGIIYFDELSISADYRSIAYTYDEAGNRTSRFVSIEEMKLKAATAPNKDNPKNKIGWSELGIKLFPNPTLGEITLEFENYPEDKRIKTELYNSEGKRILNEKINNNNTMLNIENYPEGMYILHLNVSGEQKTYKIIKK